MNARKLISGALALAFVGALIFGGREAGRRAARAGWGVGKSETAASTPKSGLSPRSRSKDADQPVDPDDAARVMDRLRRLAGGSPYLSGDWEVLLEVRRILAGLSPGMLAELGDSGYDAYSWNDILMREIREAWMKADPDGAATAMLAHGENGRTAARLAFTGWAGENAAEAFAWLDGFAFTGDADDVEALRAEFRESGLHMILARDFDLATSEFQKLPLLDESYRGRRNVMASWASQVLTDPAQRERLIDFAKSTGVPEDHAVMNQALLRDWPQEDAMGMLTYLHELRDYLESAPAGAEKQPDMDAAAVGMAIYREYDRPALEWWMERYSDRAEVPGELQSAMIGWRQKYPDAVDQWFAEQPASPQKDAMQAVLVPALAQSNPERAAELIEAISDPGIRESAIERLDYIWSRRDAEAAAEWKAGLAD